MPDHKLQRRDARSAPRRGISPACSTQKSETPPALVPQERWETCGRVPSDSRMSRARRRIRCRSPRPRVGATTVGAVPPLLRRPALAYPNARLLPVVHRWVDAVDRRLRGRVSCNPAELTASLDLAERLPAAAVSTRSQPGKSEHYGRRTACLYTVVLRAWFL